MEYMRVTLDVHPFIDPHGPETADLSQIISLQIDQHDMFGPLLRVPQELSGQAPVVLGIEPPSARPRNRTGRDEGTGTLNQPLRRGAEKSDIPRLQVCGKRGRIDLAESLIQGQRAGRSQRHRKTVGEVRLKNIP